MQPVAVVSLFHSWHMDTLGPLVTDSAGNKFILLKVEAMSGFSEAFPIKSQTAVEIADVLYKDIICRYGAMASLLTDRAQCLTGNIITELSKLMDIARVKTSSYCVTSNAKSKSKNSYKYT